MALAGELAKYAKYVGNELVKSSGKGVAKAGVKAGAKSTLSSLVPSVATKARKGVLRNVLVGKAKSVAERIPVDVGDAGKISLYRGMHADTPANLQKYIEDMENPNIVPRTYTGNAFAGDGYHFYDNIEGAREYARDGVNLGEPYGAVVKIDVPKNRFIGINSQNGNDAESFISRALERGAKNAPEVGNKDFRNYIQRNGILGSHNTSPFGDNSQYVVMNNDATSGLKAIENYENGQLMEDIVNSGADKYLPVGTKIKFNKDLSIRKTGGNFGHKGVKGMRGGSAPKIQYSLDDSGITLYHGTPNKFEDFDDTLPSVWFSDSDKNLRDTGLSIKGGQSMNIMERQLPKDLKIADEELADRLTKQQLQDRGYAGIAYTERGPNGDETYYEIFNPNKSLKKVGGVQKESLTEMSKKINAMNASRGNMADGVKRIGSAEVAPVAPETLPTGYETIKKYLETNPNTEIERIVGAKVDDFDVFPAKLKEWIEGEGYDASANVVDNLNIARRILAEQTLDEMNMAGASGYRKFLETRSRLQADNPHMGLGPRSYTISANDDQIYQTDAAKLDREYSDRLGIGRSHTPMSDKVLSSDAQGYYMGGGIGINPLYASGESGVSTIGHERMHAWQDINKGEWDSRVVDAIDELRAELKNHYHTKSQIKEYRKSGADLDYYADNKEQEARMLQSYLDNEGFTNTYRKNSERGTEWGDEIKPAFDRFFKKLRALSKKGVALPAIAGLVGIGALAGKKDDKSVDNIE